MEAITYIKIGRDLRRVYTTYSEKKIKRGMTTTILGVKFKVKRTFMEKRKSGKRQLIILKEVTELPVF